MNNNMTPEELEKMLEKAKREAQAAYEKLSPEEREQAERRARQLIEEDAAAMQKLIGDAAKVAAGPALAEKPAPKFCRSCGAPVSGGNFCEYCGKPL